MLHYDIVPVCINTDVAALFQGPVQTEGRCTFYISGGSDAVDDSVTGVVDPVPIVDAYISRISPFFIIESSNDLILFCADITVPLSDVIQNQLWRRISVFPLRSISVSCHECPCMFIHLKKYFKLFRFCLSDFHNIPLS